jgi:PAS domain S-box-containing protein
VTIKGDENELLRSVALQNATSILVARQRAERRSEAYLAEAQRLSHTGSFGWRLSTHEIIWSEETFRIFEYDRTTIPTMELVLQRAHPEDAVLVKQTIERASQAGRDFDHEYRLVMPDSSIKYVHIVAHALSDESGGIEFVGAVTDTTERKWAEEALRRSESYLAEAQRFTHTGSWAWRVAGRDALHLSEEWYRIYGFDPEEGMPAWEERLHRVHPEDRAKWQGAIDRAIGAKSDYEVEFRILLPGGTVKYIHTVGHPVLNAYGDLMGFVGSATDITERKRADEEREGLLAREQAALAESVAAQQRFLNLVNSVEGIVWEADVPSFQFLFISKQAERVLGYPVERWLSEPTFWKDHVHPEDREWALQFCQNATAEKRDYQFEYRMIAADGRVVWLRDLVTVVMEGDRVTRVRGLMVDLTNRKQAEEALRQAQSDLAHVNRVTTMGELTASLAHEVKQPIAAAVTNANTSLRWLAANPPNLEEARAAATRIVKDGKRAGEIISRIRLLFKKGTPERELVDINEVIREMIVLLRNEAMRYSISVRTEPEADLPRVVGDRVQLQQVLMNLMINGIDALKDVDGTRELIIKSQRAENGQVLVSVSDTGAGLPPQQADQIFDAFFTTKQHGTGMGLRISRSIVESHGGRLWAADNSPRGASFYLTLPAKVDTHENARRRSHSVGH